MKIPFLKNPVFLLFLIVPLFFGGICLHLGLEQMHQVQSRGETMTDLPGYLQDWRFLEEKGDLDLYEVRYCYYLGGQEYELTVTERRETPPVTDTPVTVWCEWDDPTVAQVAYKETWQMLLLAGILLLFFPFVMAVGAMLSAGVLSFGQIGLLEGAFGILFFLFGAISSYGICGSLSPAALFSAGGIGLFPLLFYLSAAFLLYRSIRPKKDRF